MDMNDPRWVSGEAPEPSAPATSNSPRWVTDAELEEKANSLKLGRTERLYAIGGARWMRHRIFDGQGGWIPTSQRRPPIDEADEWNKTHQVSVRCLVYSESWGIKFGYYHYLSGNWTIEGVHGNISPVTHYQVVTKPV